MSQAREQFLNQIAIAATENGIWSYDAVAFFAAKSTPSGFPFAVYERSPESAKKAFSHFTSEQIQWMIAHPEQIKGAYEEAMEIRFQEGISSPHYYVEKIHSKDFKEEKI